MECNLQEELCMTETEDFINKLPINVQLNELALGE